MLRLLLLLPLVAAAPADISRDNYVISIEKGVLKGIQFKGDVLPEQIDLSSMNINTLEKNALDNISGIKSLNLANNSLESLPEFIFSNLTSVEYLSLAENKLYDLKYAFVGLENLRILNISCNPILHLRRGYLFGLTKSTTILTEGNALWSISTGAFTNSFLKNEQEPKSLKIVKREADPEQKHNEMEKTVDAAANYPALKTEYMYSNKILKQGQKLKLCMPNQIVISLEPLEEGKQVAGGCLEIPIDGFKKAVSLRNLGIKGFQEGWYQLQHLPVFILDLANNEIMEITKEVLNELPEDLTYVNLMENRIRGIWSQVIENRYLKMLNLRNNLIDNIEDGALINTNLTSLFVNGNQLKSLSFVSSLPETITELVVTNNHISSIANNVFLNLPRLTYFNLAGNKITKLQDNVFKGLNSLEVLVMTRNSLKEIEPQAFNGLKKLTTLYLYRNSLSELQKGTLSNLESLYDLNLAWNKFQKITKDTFANLSRTLDSLYIDFNEIEILEGDSFVDIPSNSLSLNGNKISSIPRGAFNLPNLRHLFLNNNTFTSIDGDSFEGLPKLKRLYLSSNRITDVPKGSCKNLGGLDLLDISKNPFEKLENGALYGLSLAKGNSVYVYNNQLKELQGGVFDDV